MKKVVVIGGGISGLATAWLLRERARRRDVDLDLTLLEKEDRPGGKIRSIREEGYLCEWGPNGFLDSKPQTLELCGALGIDGKLLRSNDSARKRFIYSAGELHRLPEGALSFFASRLISWPGKLRLALEPTPLIPGPPGGIDESLADFARRRLGGEALDKLIGPMVSGIFAGDPEMMSLVSCFPRIAELEREYGGLVRAMFRLAGKRRRERAAGKAVSSPSGPGGVLTSFSEGIQCLTDTLAGSLGGIVGTGKDVVRIRRGKSAAWRIGCRDGGESEADIVIVASPAHAAADMLSGCDDALSDALRLIPYAGMAVVCLGFERKRLDHPLNGFGYLIPGKEGRTILGTLWDSSMFSNRAPEGKALLRSMVGGACFPGHIGLGDDEMTARVRHDLRETMGIDTEPSFIRIFRHQKAIPQYTVGHGARLKFLGERLGALPGLILTGNSYRGIGLNDCVAAAERAADEALELVR